MVLILDGGSEHVEHIHVSLFEIKLDAAAEVNKFELTK